MELLMKLLKSKSNLSDHEDNFGLPARYSSTLIELTPGRIIWLNEPFTTEVASAMSALLIYYDTIDPNADISIYINSVGGEEAALVHIYDIIRMISAPVRTICVGKAYSAGAFLLAAGSKGKRFIFPNAKVMIHGVQVNFPLQGEDDPKGSENYMNFIKSRNDVILKLLSEDTGQSLDKIKTDLKRDVYLTAQEAIEYGIIDSIITESK
jgi:ATP-dependent Clp protease protease subunit